jgi:hypothetical protein
MAMNVARVAAGAAVLMAFTVDLAAAKPVTVVAEVNLRKTPGTDSEVLTLIPKGTMVEVGTCTNGWCQVSYNGQDGYSIAPNLGLAPRPAPHPAAGDPAGYPPPPGGAYPPPPGYVVGPPVYYGPPAVYYGPCCYYGGGPYYRGGWGWHRHW